VAVRVKEMDDLSGTFADGNLPERDLTTIQANRRRGCRDTDEDSSLWLCGVVTHRPNGK
jgi:hypothetical protein